MKQTLYNGIMLFDGGETCDDVFHIGKINAGFSGSANIIMKDFYEERYTSSEEDSVYGIDLLGDLTGFTGMLTLKDPIERALILLHPKSTDSNISELNCSLTGNKTIFLQPLGRVKTVKLNGDLSTFTGKIHIYEGLAVNIANMANYPNIHVSGNVISFNPNLTLQSNNFTNKIKFVM